GREGDGNGKKGEVKFSGRMLKKSFPKRYYRSSASPEEHPESVAPARSANLSSHCSDCLCDGSQGTRGGHGQQWQERRQTQSFLPLTSQPRGLLFPRRQSLPQSLRRTDVSRRRADRYFDLRPSGKRDPRLRLVGGTERFHRSNADQDLAKHISIFPLNIG